MKVSWHGVNVEISDEAIVRLERDRVTAVLLKFACDIYEEYCDTGSDMVPETSFAPPRIELLPHRAVFVASIKGNIWALEVPL